MGFMRACIIAAALGMATTAGDRRAHTLAHPPASDGADWPSILQQRLDHEGIVGTLVLGGGGDLGDAAKDAFASAVPAGTAVVIIPTAAAKPDQAAASAAAWLRSAGIRQIVIHPTRTAPAASGSDASAPDASDSSGPDAAGGTAGGDDPVALAELLRSAGGVWICGGRQSRLAAAFAGSVVEVELQALLKRGGVIGGNSAGAAILSGVMIASGDKRPQITAGFDVVPGAIVDQHFSQRERLERLRFAVAEHPDRFGLGIDEATAVVIHGRRLQVIGEGAATIVLANSSRHEGVEQPVPAGALVDLTQLQRAARWRAAEVDPGQSRFGPPHVASGSLVIVGGGGMSQEIVDRFLALAGGKAARIVVLPTAVPRREAFRSRVPGFLARAEVASVTLLPHSRTEEIADEVFEQALQEATGIWFDGGRQWNFVDAYENTRAIELFHAVLRRGGVIGGSSAGATIQGEYLVRGHPLGNTVMMAEGYERGFAFLPGVAIDQHFSQRQRQRDLIPVIRRHPQLLGIGIDEATALVVSGSRAEVIGEHAVHFLRIPNPLQQEPAVPEGDRAASADEPPPEAAEPQHEDLYVSVAAGQAIDLQTLRRLPAPQKAPPQEAVEQASE